MLIPILIFSWHCFLNAKVGGSTPIISRTYWRTYLALHS